MCTNSARLVSSLECYMDELVENFEDFVKKSLLIISIAVGALIVMLGYVLKVITERAQMVPIGSSPAGEGWSRQYLAGSPAEERTTQFLQGSSTAEGWSRFLPGSTTVEERQEGEIQTEGRQREERQAGGWTRFLPGSTIAEGRQEETKQADEKQGEGWATRIFPGSTTVEGRQAEERQVEGGQAEDRQAESRQGGWLAAGKQAGGGQAQGWLAAGKQTVGGLTQERQTEEGQAQGRQAERGQTQERQAEGRQAVGWLAGGRQADGGQAQERQPEGRTRQYFTNLSSSTEYPQSSSNTSLPVDAAKSSRSGPLAQRSANALKMKNDFRQTSSIGAHTGPMSSLPSFDEKVLRNVGLSSCSKSCMQGKRSILRNCSSPRIAIPSMPTCIPNHHISNPRPCTKYVKTRSSCCSMCCADDDRR